MFLDAKAPHLSSKIPPSLPWNENEPVQPSEGLTRLGCGLFTFGQSEELRCVIAIIRHGDRAPKQKVVLKVTEEKLLNLMLKYNGGKARSETKLKTVVQLQDLLDVTRLLVPRTRPGRETDSEAEDIEHTEKLRQVEAVLEEGDHFSGMYRKVQLKPLKWVIVPKDNGEGEEKPVEALMVLKYGGGLTHTGRKQAEDMGRYFRNNVYPGEGTGLLRLHCTYRHDLKIYSSDEGCVQMSAAAFAKGLLDLEGQLIPTLVSLVSKDASMLDGIDNAIIKMEEAKVLANFLTPNEYEINPKQKLKMGSKIARRLLSKILIDIRNTREEAIRTDAKTEEHVRTRLYFTLESHIHSLMNVLRYCNIGEDSLVCDSDLDSKFKTEELDYMSYIVLRMFENTELPLEDPKRFRIERTFGPSEVANPV